MIDELKTYLQLTFAHSIFEKSTDVISEFEQFTQGRLGEILDVHVGNYVTQGGAEDFDSLWLFTEDCVAEVRDFVQDRYYLRIIPMHESIEYFEIQYNRLDRDGRRTKIPGDSTRMRVVFWTGVELRCELNAAGENCRHLAELAQRRIVPNVRAVSPAQAGRQSNPANERS